MPDPRTVRTCLDQLLQEPAVVREKLNALPSEPVTYACGDLYGASYYALSHNRSEAKPASILIEFEVPLDSLCVDGKDFLYTVFQRAEGCERVRACLASLFGKSILRYFDHASARSDTQEKIGICDLACYDIDVVRNHAENQTLILGRWGTHFCSAFKLQLPVPSSAIQNIDCNPTFPKPSEDTVHLKDML